MSPKVNICICGAGIAGIATAYYLLMANKDLSITIVDKNQPMSFTTSKSGENYRNYWPQKCMRQFVSHSIELMKDMRLTMDEPFEMIENGYNFVSHDSNNSIFNIDFNENYGEDDLDEIVDTNKIKIRYPYLDKQIEKVLRIKKAGRIDVYAMGSYMLKEAHAKGLKLIQGEIVNISKADDSFKVELNGSQNLNVDQLVIATGPFLNHIAAMLGFEFAINNIVQRKFIIPDPLNVIPKDMPFTIYADAQFLNWSKNEFIFLKEEKKYRWLTNKLPGGLHIRPDGNGIKLGWAFQTQKVEAQWEVQNIDLFPHAVLKGASRFIPALGHYAEKIPTPIIEYGGHYTRTKENLPLIGPTEVKDVFVVGALAGYGTMSACAAGKLCTDYILDELNLPSYAPYFHPKKYNNEAIIDELSAMVSDGQL